MVDDGRGVLYRYVGDNDPLWVNPYQPIRLDVVTKQAQKGVELAARYAKIAPSAAASGLLGMAGGSFGEIEPSRTHPRQASCSPHLRRLSCPQLGVIQPRKAEVEMTLSQSLGPLLGKEVSS